MAYIASYIRSMQYIDDGSQSYTDSVERDITVSGITDYTKVVPFMLSHMNDGVTRGYRMKSNTTLGVTTTTTSNYRYRFLLVEFR